LRPNALLVQILYSVLAVMYYPELSRCCNPRICQQYYWSDARISASP